MDTNETPFLTGWWSFDLPGYSQCDGTYCLVPYETLPPLDDRLFRGNFQWLREQDEYLQQIMSIYQPSAEEQQKLIASIDQLTVSAQQRGLKLPEAFLHFMGSAQLQARIPSCTACYFSLSEHILESPGEDGGYLIRFLNDQQDVLLWYLYLNHKGEHCVLVTPLWLDEDEELGNLTPEALKRNLLFCAPTFEAFIYRFWLENEIWFALSEGHPLTEVQRKYLERIG